jgi:hypothetical protein
MEVERKGGDNERLRLLCQRDCQHVRSEVCACERAEIPVEAQRRRTIVKVRGGFAIELCARVGSTGDARPRPHVLIVRRARLRVAGGALNTIEQQPQQKEGGEV